MIARKSTSADHGPAAHVGRTVLIGFFTVAPLWVTWLVFDFLLGILAGAGTPLLRTAARLVAPKSETLSSWLLDFDLQKLVAVQLTLGALYGIGLLASMVLGKRLIDGFQTLLNRLPLVQSVHGGAKRFLQMLRKPPVSGQRVVLISFPTPEMKAVGLVTKIMHDTSTGRELAAVHVPTSPNPTSGYIEIVPLDEVVQTDWTIEQSMSFVMTGGANAPDKVAFARAAARENGDDPDA